MKKQYSEKRLRISEIKVLKDLQQRDEPLTARVVNQYTQALNAGRTFRDPIEVWWLTDRKFWALVDGNHRLAAFGKVGETNVLCKTTEGTWEEAKEASLLANQENGFQRNVNTKAIVVRGLFELHPDWSNKRMFKETTVYMKLIKEVRRAMVEEGLLDVLSVKGKESGKREWVDVSKKSGVDRSTPSKNQTDEDEEEIAEEQEEETPRKKKKPSKRHSEPVDDVESDSEDEGGGEEGGEDDAPEQDSDPKSEIRSLFDKLDSDDQDLLLYSLIGYDRVLLSNSDSPKWEEVDEVLEHAGAMLRRLSSKERKKCDPEDVARTLGFVE